MGNARAARGQEDNLELSYNFDYTTLNYTGRFAALFSCCGKAAIIFDLFCRAITHRRSRPNVIIYVDFILVVLPHFSVAAAKRQSFWICRGNAANMRQNFPP